jgi:hypothetical protein
MQNDSTELIELIEELQSTESTAEMRFCMTNEIKRIGLPDRRQYGPKNFVMFRKLSKYVKNGCSTFS